MVPTLRRMNEMNVLETRKAYAPTGCRSIDRQAHLPEQKCTWM